VTIFTGPVDLSALFNIDMEPEAEASSVADVSALMCPKCRGRGQFIGYTGRVVGPCFTCEGSGLARSAGVAVKPGDCVKCLGSGEWRPGRQCFACNGTGRERVQREAVAVDVSAIGTAFGAARDAGVKAPKLRLGEFMFSRAPDHGKNAGAIYVKGACRGDYLGKVVGGQFHATRECDDGTRAEVVAVAGDPYTAAKAYGAKFGLCSCCGRDLSNPESVALGIGPICRDKFGW
jgi:hypothetical protein